MFLMRFVILYKFTIKFFITAYIIKMKVHTSVLRRATKTVWMVMQELELEWVPVYPDWRLNEQQFGGSSWTE